MVYGTTTFKCDECGNQFESLAAEMGPIAVLTPMPCPNCGGCHTYPVGTVFCDFYRKIWETMDKKTNKSRPKRKPHFDWRALANVLAKGLNQHDETCR